VTRPRRGRQRRQQQLAPEQIAWLHGEQDSGAWLYLVGTEGVRDFWREYADEIVAEHIVEYPGTRPRRWWQFDASRPRRRVGGTGTPCHECLAYNPRLEYGVPADWINQTIDPRDPPLYESEAAYLKRLRLLLPPERRRLSAGDFEPESVIEVLGIHDGATDALAH